MIEVFTMALHQSNIIINILLVSAFLLNLVLHSLLSSWRRTANSIWAWLLVLVFTFSRIHIVFIIRSPNTENIYLNSPKRIKLVLK